MIEDMQLRGFSARTQECYVAAVRQLADHYHTRPDRLTEEDLRRYFLYLANEKKVARATATIVLCGIKFFYEHTVQRTWTTLRLVRPPREKKLPAVTLRPDVLLLDDFGLKALRAPGPEDLYDIIHERYERASIVLTSSRDRSEWADLFGEPLLASAALDRLTHRAHFLEVTGPSYRAEQTKQQLAAQQRSKPSPKQEGRTA
jgi:hypothetical protein